MKTLQELQKDGIDIDGAMERFMENEEKSEAKRS